MMTEEIKKHVKISSDDDTNMQEVAIARIARQVLNVHLELNDRVGRGGGVEEFTDSEKEIINQLLVLFDSKYHNTVAQYLSINDSYGRGDNQATTATTQRLFRYIIQYLTQAQCWYEIRLICDKVKFTFCGYESGVLCYLLDDEFLSDSDRNLLITNVHTVVKGASGLNKYHDTATSRRRYQRSKLVPRVLQINPLAVDRKFNESSYRNYVHYYFMSSRSWILTRGAVPKYIAVFVARQWRAYVELSSRLNHHVEGNIIFPLITKFVPNPGFEMLNSINENKYDASRFMGFNELSTEHPEDVARVNQTDLLMFFKCLLDFVPRSVLLHKDSTGRCILSIMDDLMNLVVGANKQLSAHTTH